MAVAHRRHSRDHLSEKEHRAMSSSYVTGFLHAASLKITSSKRRTLCRSATAKRQSRARFRESAAPTAVHRLITAPSDLNPSVPGDLVHGGSVGDVQPLRTFGGGSPLEITVDASSATTTETPVSSEVSFTITDINTSYQNWDVSLLVYDNGTEEDDDSVVVAYGYAIEDESPTVGSDGSAGPLLASDADDDSPWVGESGQDYFVLPPKHTVRSQRARRKPAALSSLMQ